MSEENQPLEEIFSEMRLIQQHFLTKYSVNDIWSNSKIYEVLQANTLGHELIPGHSGTLDAADKNGREYEYKHFKESSSNHSWTFNDYSNSTIQKLEDKVHAVVFAHIDDLVYPPVLDWAYEAKGSTVANYLRRFTAKMTNHRRMINISARQLENRADLSKKFYDVSLSSGPYGEELIRIFSLISKLESLVGTRNILTSNKFWEVLVSLPLNHKVNSEQGGRAGAHDAYDLKGRDYEYKVSSSKSWNFQDISPAVLQKYLTCEEIVLAVVDKTNIYVKDIWMAKPENVVPRLKEKLKDKEESYALQNKEVRRLMVTLSTGDLALINARKIS